MTAKKKPYFLYPARPKTCAETGALIRRSDKAAYEPGTRKFYANFSEFAHAVRDQLSCDDQAADRYPGA